MAVTAGRLHAVPPFPLASHNGSDGGTQRLPLGERLKQLCQERGWSQAELAAKVDADAGQSRRHENGRVTPSAEGVLKIADGLDFISYLLVETTPRRPPHTPENILGDHPDTITKLADDDLGVLRSVIDGLVAKTRLRTLAGGS